MVYLVKFGKQTRHIDLVSVLSEGFGISKTEVRRRLKQNAEVSIIIYEEEK